jgi:hypothetical protein
MATAGLISGRALSTAFGLVMVAATAIAADGPSLWVAAVAAVLVALGFRFAAAATLAVVLSVLVIALTDPPPMAAALAGVAATAYLVLRHARNVDSALAVPTVIGALSFSAIGLAAVAIPVSAPWLPLAAPAVVVLSYVIVVRPLLATRGPS